jgi:hypothetical protein
MIDPKLLPCYIIRYENGELSDRETLQLFSWLIRKGLVDRLQGGYNCTANSLIAGGYIASDGMILAEDYYE